MTAPVVSLLSSGIAVAATSTAYSRARWARHAGRTFTITAGSGKRSSAVLESIADLRGAPAGADQRFSLVFRSARTLPTGNVTVSRSGFAAVPLFVTAVDRGVDAQHRQAVVNRI